MPYKNPMNCMYPGCPNKVYKGRYCDKHKINTNWFRNNAGWKRIRQQVLEEEPRCRYCGAEAKEVDHITPLPIGTSERYNLQALCKRCHSIKTRKEVSR
jgi:5-methylcytosine-specific restriction protein A